MSIQVSGGVDLGGSRVSKKKEPQQDRAFTETTVELEVDVDDERVALLDDGGGGVGGSGGGVGVGGSGGGGPRSRGKRLVSLDMLRGFVMVVMCMVDEQGDFDHVFWAFREHEWNGVGPADLVFPMFLFIVGNSVVLAFRNRSIYETKVWTSVLRRTLLLIVFGILLSLFSHKFNFHHFTILGVLQRIGIVYGAITLLYTLAPIFAQRLIVLGLVTLYAVCLYEFPVPNFEGVVHNQTVLEECGTGVITPYCNAASFFDRSIFGQNYMPQPVLNEGILSTLTAIATAYAGTEFGRLWSAVPKKSDGYWAEGKWKILVWVGSAIACILSSLLLQVWVPYNKPIWSLSFTLLTAGVGGLLLFLFYVIYDLPLTYIARKYLTIITTPLVWLGRNPLFFFLLMMVIDIVMMHLINVAGDSGQISLWTLVYERAFHSWISDPYIASSMVPFSHLLIYTLLCFFLHRKKWFLTL
eukprot:TRINITY_DN6030_c0_g1_i1.p1 TRINITY_DN6030_c0_g1~~TRINITY_DN6030_c0_g1_i1.p1  ORF type:complete len:482 (+),score=56.99 TRINITY_DN6030_c0_g1_i1:45-1448(+)